MSVPSSGSTTPSSAVRTASTEGAAPSGDPAGGTAVGAGVHGMIEPNGAVEGGLLDCRPQSPYRKETSRESCDLNCETRSTPQPVTLTDAAVAKVTGLLAQEGDDGLALRVAVRPGGCSGYSYEMFFDSELADDDIVRSFGPVRVVVDPESAELIRARRSTTATACRRPASTSRTRTRREPAVAARRSAEPDRGSA